MASFVIATHDGTFLEWQRRGLELKPPEIIYAFRTFVLDALRATPPVASKSKTATK